MKKVFKIFLQVCLLVSFGILLASCDSPDNAKEVTGITFSNVTVAYDGTEKEVIITGELPAGVTAQYTNNKGTNVGVYSASALLSGQGYQTLTLTAVLTITGIEIDDLDFSDEEFDFDGTEKELLVTGVLPTGVTVQYIGNKATNAGTYNASAIISGQGYQTLTLTATLTINKINITGITFSDVVFSYDGNKKELLVTGVLPAGVTVEYSGNVATDIGTYNATATLSGANYNTLILSADLTIKNSLKRYIDFAAALFDYIIEKPDAFLFLPEKLRMENRICSSFTTLDYTNFVNIADIPMGIGEQLNVFYDSISFMNSILTAANVFYSTVAQVIELYTIFIDSDPVDPTYFEKTIGSFSFIFIVNEEYLELMAKVGSIQVETTVIEDENGVSYSGRIEISEANVLKYEVTPNSMKIAIRALGINRSQIEFTKDENITSGSVYIYTGIEPVALVKRVLIYSDDNYTSVVGEEGDIVEKLSKMRSVETYRNSDGLLIGSEVLEEFKVAGVGPSYNTLWFSLSVFNGFNTIRVNDKLIYINDSATVFNTLLVGGSILDLKRASRRYDIEMRKEYIFVYNSETEEYSKIEILVPRLFVQEEQLSTLFTDIASQNNGLSISFNQVLSTTDYATIKSRYIEILTLYEALKEMTPQAVLDYIGTKKEF